MRSGICLLVCALSLSASACLNDSETLRRQPESRDPELIVLGFFDRYPKSLYEARVKWLLPQAEKNQLAFFKYDDLAVAYDRIGKSDEAIRWIRHKSALIARSRDNDRGWIGAPATIPTKLGLRKYAAYTSEANLGTFLAHRWLARGRDPQRVSELEQAVRHLENAVKINPDAHSGREWAQIDLLNWMIGEVRQPTRRYPTFNRPESEVINGLVGLIELGNGWNSVDIFRIIAQQSNSNPRLVALATLRARELDRAGGSALFRVENPQPTLTDYVKGIVMRSYGQVKSLRSRADNEHKRLEDFVNRRLAEGALPDDSETFWANKPTYPTPEVVLYAKRPSKLYSFLGYPMVAGQFAVAIIASVAVAATIFTTAKRLRKR